MSEIHSKEDLQYIVENLIDELRECEDGTTFDTFHLLERAGYDGSEFDHDDLYDIHFTLLKKAKENHITLDMSAHDGMVEGLPFHLDYIVRNKRAQIKCPYCSSKNTARILYGYPAYSEELQKKLDNGKIAIGGCCISGAPVDGGMIRTDPSRVCNNCKKKFGKPPLIISREMDSVEDYRDIVESIYFSVGGFFQGNTKVTITRSKKGALVKVEKTHSAEEIPDRQITKKKWNRILNLLYDKMYLHEWKKTYYDPDVSDGEQWELKIKLTGKRRRNYEGSNAYPPYWPELTKLFREYTK